MAHLLGQPRSLSALALFIVLLQAPPPTPRWGAGALSLPPSTSASFSTSAAPGRAEGPGRFVVPLHRQSVPVRSGKNSLSFKTVYFGSIALGAPSAQLFDVVFDTGSGHVIVPSTECDTETCRIHRRYSREASSLAQDIDYDGTPVQQGSPRDQISVGFGTGEVEGHIISDRICLGESGVTFVARPPGDAQDEDDERRPGEASAAGAASSRGAVAGGAGEAVGSSEPPHCAKLRVITATEMSYEPFYAFDFDGVLGLGLESLALAPEFSFFGALAAKGRLAEPSFAVFLADSDDEVSEISFGGPALAERLAPEAKGELFWAPVERPELGHWQVRIRRLRLGNRILDFCEDGRCVAAVDTGTSLLTVPSGAADAVLGELEAKLRNPGAAAPKTDDGSVDCRFAEGASLVFELDGGYRISLGPADYARPSATLPEEEMEADADLGAAGEAERAATGQNADEEEDEDEDLPLIMDECRPTVMAMEVPEPLGPKLFIWGEPVLRKYYTVYNWEEKKVGFGLAAHSGGSRPRVTTTAPTLASPSSAEAGAVSASSDAAAVVFGSDLEPTRRRPLLL